MHDSGWKRSDREAALEWVAEQDLICDGCGLPRDETMGDEALGQAVEYNATARRCRGCEAISASARAQAGIEDPDPTAGVFWHLERAET